jgi:hypothetical protein
VREFGFHLVLCLDSVAGIGAKSRSLASLGMTMVFCGWRKIQGTTMSFGMSIPIGFAGECCGEAAIEFTGRVARGAAPGEERLVTEGVKRGGAWLSAHVIPPSSDAIRATRRGFGQ